MKVVTVHTVEDLDENFEGPTCEVHIEWRAGGWYRPAQINAPPEQCYEAEYPEYEIERATVTEFGRLYDVGPEEVTAFIPYAELEKTAAYVYENCPFFGALIR